MKFTAMYVKVPEGYAAFAGELPGSNTQGETIEEARENLKEAIELVLAAIGCLRKSRFAVGK